MLGCNIEFLTYIQFNESWSSVFTAFHLYNKHRYTGNIDSPFKRLCDLCDRNNHFADDLLNYQKIDIATYAQFLDITSPTITSGKRSQFKTRRSVFLLSDLMNVAEEAFAYLVFENCFEQWRWTAEQKSNNIGIADIHGGHGNSTSSSSSSSVAATSCVPIENQNIMIDCNNDVNQSVAVSPLKGSAPHCGGRPQLRQQSLQSPPLSQSSNDNESNNSCEESAVEGEDDDGSSCTQVGPGYRYQYAQVRTDNKHGAGPWTPEGMDRYNAIVRKILSARKVRKQFEDHLRTYYMEHDRKGTFGTNNKRKNKRHDTDDDGGTPKKVVVIDLFSLSDD